MNNVRNMLAYKAQRHTDQMNLLYSDNIKRSIDGTIMWEDGVVKDLIHSNRSNDTKIHVEDMCSVTALLETGICDKYSNIAMLNFASYKEPGGRFLEGSSAQEEALCHESYLYNVLEAFVDDYYTPNHDTLNNGLYKDNLLYVPNIYFSRNNNGKACDVIVCAAPNKGVAMRYGKVTTTEYMDALHSRIDAILYTAFTNHVECLILGAFGCGVFRNDPMDVASTFKDLLTGKYAGAFHEVIFPIPQNPKNHNFSVFNTIFNSPKKG